MKKNHKKIIKHVFEKICKDISSLKIQGAEEIAKKAFYAYKLIPTKSSKRKLLSLRPTEPMLENVLNLADKLSYKELIKKLESNQNKINYLVFKLIKNNNIIFTHCHSSTIVKALIFAKKKRKRFEVYNTETRPLFQGRKTAKELRRAGIKVATFIDSAAKIALTKDQDKEEKTRKVSFVFFGSDALTKKGVINKVGSGMFAEIAKDNNIPVYIISDSLKYTLKNIKFEQRNPREIWKAPKFNLKNPAFELIKKENIKAIISELGILSYNQFLKRIKEK